jgi:chain length determinant protein tyrosine kinase EpsG
MITRTTKDGSGTDRGRAIGAILVEHGRLNPRDLDLVQRYAVERSIRFGAAAVQLNLITLEDVNFALAQQFKYPVFRRGDQGVSEEVVAAHGPQNEVVEPIRALRTQLMLRWLTGAHRKLLAITSPDRGEGRSWLSANLAVAFAQVGMRTLLIDADMRRPQQHRLFNLDNALGLSALLTGRGGSSTVCRVHPQMRLSVLPAGSTPPNPQELLASSAFTIVLDRFAEQYEQGVVLIDTPAAMETSDAQLIVARAGAAIVLCRLNHSRQSRLEALTRDLKCTGAQILGGVLNEY